MKETGVNVIAINASYGSQGGDQSDPMRDVIAKAGEAGIIFVTSAGNQSSDNDQIASFPASYDASNIITVAASDPDDKLALFSNYGLNSIDLAAPGENIFSTAIEVAALVTSQDLDFTAVSFELVAQADGQYLASLETSSVTVVNAVSSYRYADGTSMAAPHVTGAIAILAAAFPAESVSQRIDRILEGTDPIETLAGLVSAGGRLNLNQSLRLYETGDVNLASIYHILLFENK
jgi:subtilisin family serine protease